VRWLGDDDAVAHLDAACFPAHRLLAPSVRARASSCWVSQLSNQSKKLQRCPHPSRAVSRFIPDSPSLTEYGTVSEGGQGNRFSTVEALCSLIPSVSGFIPEVPEPAGPSGAAESARQVPPGKGRPVLRAIRATDSPMGTPIPRVTQVAGSGLATPAPHPFPAWTPFVREASPDPHLPPSRCSSQNLTLDLILSLDLILFLKPAPAPTSPPPPSTGTRRAGPRWR
jgi:hypothetical protein